MEEPRNGNESKIDSLTLFTTASAHASHVTQGVEQNVDVAAVSQNNHEVQDNQDIHDVQSHGGGDGIVGDHGIGHDDEYHTTTTAGGGHRSKMKKDTKKHKKGTKTNGYEAITTNSGSVSVPASGSASTTLFPSSDTFTASSASSSSITPLTQLHLSLQQTENEMVYANFTDHFSVVPDMHEHANSEQQQQQQQHEQQSQHQMQPQQDVHDQNPLLPPPFIALQPYRELGPDEDHLIMMDIIGYQRTALRTFRHYLCCIVLNILYAIFWAWFPSKYLRFRYRVVLDLTQAEYVSVSDKHGRATLCPVELLNPVSEYEYDDDPSLEIDMPRQDQIVKQKKREELRRSLMMKTTTTMQKDRDNGLKTAADEMVSTSASASTTSTSTSQNDNISILNVPPEDRMIVFRYRRYPFNPLTGAFELLRSPETASTLDLMHRASGMVLNKEERDERKRLFGRNFMAIPVPSIPRLLVTEILHPFFVFQMYSIILWNLENYYIFAAVIAIMAAVTVAMNLRDTRANLFRLRDLARTEHTVKVVRGLVSSSATGSETEAGSSSLSSLLSSSSSSSSVTATPPTAMANDAGVGVVGKAVGKSVGHGSLGGCTSNSGVVIRHESELIIETISSSDLVPGDVVLLDERTDVACDMTLLTGSVVVNEAMLTGESIPVVKAPIVESLSTSSSSNSSSSTSGLPTAVSSPALQQQAILGSSTVSKLGTPISIQAPSPRNFAIPAIGGRNAVLQKFRRAQSFSASPAVSVVGANGGSLLPPPSPNFQPMYHHHHHERSVPSSPVAIAAVAGITFPTTPNPLLTGMTTSLHAASTASTAGTDMMLQQSYEANGDVPIGKDARVTLFAGSRIVQLKHPVLPPNTKLPSSSTAPTHVLYDDMHEDEVEVKVNNDEYPFNALLDDNPSRIAHSKPSQLNGCILAMVTSTGFATTKGNMVSSIMFPPKSSFRFEQQSFKFVGLLFLVAMIGFILTMYRMAQLDADLQLMLLRACDLVTIVVPPSLPLAMTVGISFSLVALQRMKIFCVVPSRINLAGKIKLMCFDKTGTLTSDSLQYRGVHTFIGTSDVVGSDNNNAGGVIGRTKSSMSRSIISPISEIPSLSSSHHEESVHAPGGSDRSIPSIASLASPSAVDSLASPNSLASPDFIFDRHSLPIPFRACLATCHSLAKHDGEFIGDPLEVEAFSASCASYIEPHLGHGVTFHAYLKTSTDRFDHDTSSSPYGAGNNQENREYREKRKDKSKMAVAATASVLVRPPPSVEFGSDLAESLTRTTEHRLNMTGTGRRDDKRLSSNEDQHDHQGMLIRSQSQSQNQKRSKKQRNKSPQEVMKMQQSIPLLSQQQQPDAGGDGHDSTDEHPEQVAVFFEEFKSVVDMEATTSPTSPSIEFDEDYDDELVDRITSPPASDAVIPMSIEPSMLALSPLSSISNSMHLQQHSSPPAASSSSSSSSTFPHPIPTAILGIGRSVSAMTRWCVIKQFPFEAKLQRMSVLACDEATGDLVAFVKGAPEMIASFCDPTTIPSDFYHWVDKYGHAGFRVIALASKVVPIAEEHRPVPTMDTFTSTLYTDHARAISSGGSNSGGSGGASASSPGQDDNLVHTNSDISNQNNSVSGEGFSPSKISSASTASTTTAPFSFSSSQPNLGPIVPLNYQQLNQRLSTVSDELASLDFTDLRKNVESNLKLLGLLVLENALKPETTPTLNELTQAGLRSVMVTGDNAKTAVSIARECGIVPENTSVFVSHVTKPKHTTTSSDDKHDTSLGEDEAPKDWRLTLSPSDIVWRNSDDPSMILDPVTFEIRRDDIHQSIMYQQQQYHHSSSSDNGNDNDNDNSNTPNSRSRSRSSIRNRKRVGSKSSHSKLNQDQEQDYVQVHAIAPAPEAARLGAQPVTRFELAVTGDAFAVLLHDHETTLQAREEAELRKELSMYTTNKKRSSSGISQHSSSSHSSHSSHSTNLSNSSSNVSNASSNEDENEENDEMDEDLTPDAFKVLEAKLKQLQEERSSNDWTSLVSIQEATTLQRVILAGCVFARMTPDQKASLVLQFQRVGIYTGMCGDGANDCAALKAGHIGVSLAQCEASIAAPFTSLVPNISCIPSLLCEGRSSLVTSFQLFRYMALYSVVQFSSAIYLYYLGGNYCDYQFLYQDLFVVFPLVLLMGRTPASTKLSKKRPSGNLLSRTNLISIALHMITSSIIQFMVFSQSKHQHGYREYPNDAWQCQMWEATTLHYFASFQYVLFATLFAFGLPWKRIIFYNRGLTLWLLASTALTLCFFFFGPIRKFFITDSDVPMTQAWKIKVVFCMIFQCVVCSLIEFVLVPWGRKLYDQRRKKIRANTVFGKGTLLLGQGIKPFHAIRRSFEDIWPERIPYVRVG